MIYKMTNTLYNTLKYIDFDKKKKIILTHGQIITMWNEMRDFKVPIDDIITY